MQNNCFRAFNAPVSILQNNTPCRFIKLFRALENGGAHIKSSRLQTFQKIRSRQIFRGSNVLHADNCGDEGQFRKMTDFVLGGIAAWSLFIWRDEGQPRKMTDFVLGGIAACGAGFFTNPLEVVKTRMQLQGELQKRGEYRIHYRNSLHAFYTIGKMDGLLSLQKGLVPALWYQLFMNGVRLGTYQMICNSGVTKDARGDISWPRSVLAGAVAGCMGAAVGSPFYMVKTHLQARSSDAIAVGTQHRHDTMLKGFTMIYREQGIIGLWRGTSAAVSRVMIGSAVQLSTFSTTKEYIVKKKLFHETSLFNALLASMISGVVVVACMTPFDVVSTRMYNQPTDVHGKGIKYKNLGDCFVKIFSKEGLWGFYKGLGPSFFRLVPHTILSLVFWDQTKLAYSRYANKGNKER